VPSFASPEFQHLRQRGRFAFGSAPVTPALERIMKLSGYFPFSKVARPLSWLDSFRFWLLQARQNMSLPTQLATSGIARPTYFRQTAS